MTDNNEYEKTPEEVVKLTDEEHISYLYTRMGVMEEELNNVTKKVNLREQMMTQTHEEKKVLEGQIQILKEVFRMVNSNGEGCRY